MIYSKVKLSAILTMLTFLLLSGCDDSVADSVIGSSFPKPDVNAGADQEISTPTDSVWLMGSVKIRTYNAKTKKIRWSQISGPERVTIVNREQLTAGFDLPATTGEYEFKLVVTDTYNNSDDDSVKITITGAASKKATIGVQNFAFSNDKITKKLSSSLKTALNLSDGYSRELMVKIWYPAQPDQDEDNRHDYGFHTLEQPVPSDPSSADYQQTLASFQATAVKSDSFYQASPIENTAYPVIFYSHGNDGFIEENQAYYEALVKQGYVVVSIGHTGEASYVTVNNGIGVGSNMVMQQDMLRQVAEPNLSKLLTQEEINQLASLPLGSNITPELLNKLHYSINEIKTGFQDHLNLWVEDTNFVLKQLKQINTSEIDSNLKGIFDLSKVAASGHSFGGAMASRFCNQEPNCLASINLDGAIVSEEKITDPYLAFRGDAEVYIEDAISGGADNDESVDTNDGLKQTVHLVNHAEIHAAQSDLYILSLKSTSHADFIQGWRDLHTNGLGKSILHPILEKSSIQFLNYYLKPEQYPDAQQNLCHLIVDEDDLVPEYSEACF